MPLLLANLDQMNERHCDSQDSPIQTMMTQDHYSPLHHPYTNYLRWPRVAILKTKNCNSHHPHCIRTKVGMNRCNMSQRSLMRELATAAPSIQYQIYHV